MKNAQNTTIYQHTEVRLISLSLSLDGQRVFLNRNRSVTVEDLTE